MWRHIALRQWLRLTGLELAGSDGANLSYPVGGVDVEIFGNEVTSSRNLSHLVEHHGLAGRVRVAEHVVEDRLGKGVEVGEDSAALGAQRVGVVEDRGDAALLGDGWRTDRGLL